MYVESLKNKNNAFANDNPLVFTLFKDKTIHRISVMDKIHIGKFIEIPYKENDNKIFIFTDNISIGNYKSLILSNKVKQSMAVENAGGNSEYSEALSMHYFENIFNASDFILEKEVEYWSNYKMVDYICTIMGKRIGVSVTRAMGFPTSRKFKYSDAIHLLRRKINGLIIACDLVITKHGFEKSILHIWCQNARISKLLMKAYKNFSLESVDHRILCDLALIITISNNKDIYTNLNYSKNNVIKIY